MDRRVETVNTLIVGGGQAGLAMSAQLSRRGVDHVVVERHRVAERWRSERWDSLVANGPAWHDRFPELAYTGVDDDVFPTRDRIVEYFEEFARLIDAPVRCGVDVVAAEAKPDGKGFVVTTSDGVIEARNIVAATGPFQKPVIPAVVPPEVEIMQIHSSRYRNPEQLPDGAVFVVGAGASGSQIADELLRAGRCVYLSVGPHDRPPIRYRGKDFCWWLGVLGLWDAATKRPGMEHVTIAVSGAYGGHTVDFREFAARGMTLVGRVERCSDDGVAFVAADLERNIVGGDDNYLYTLDLADAYVDAHGLDLPPEPDARRFDPLPDSVTDPIRQLDLREAGVTSIIWATGYTLDFGWLRAGTYDAQGRPSHRRGITDTPGLYFLGLPWLSRRASAFIFGVWRDAEYIAEHLTEHR